MERDKEIKMSKVITEEELRGWIEQGEVIQEGNTTCAEGIKYDFRLGDKFLKAYFGRTMDYEVDLQSAEDKRRAVVEPGEVVFVLSKERLKLPDNVYVQLSPKRSLSQDGIELMGGLTIDPGYEGYLVFGLRNVAGIPFSLCPGTKIVGANFFQLSNEEMTKEIKKPTPIEEFPEKLLNLIEKYKPVNPQNLAEELRKLQKAFEESQGHLASDVGELKDKVSKISQELLVESTKREQENKVLSEKFSNVEGKLESLTRESIKHDETLKNMHGTLQAIDTRTTQMKDDLSRKNGAKEVKSGIWASVITFLITVIGGIVVAFLQGWISFGK